MGLFSGLAGNLSEVSVEELQKDYGQFLVEGETIETGFKTLRDVLLFTDRRIIDFDKQGATGKKMRVESVHLDTIFEVSCETAGAGIDDSEIEITYIRSPYKKAKQIDTGTKKFEFPKKFDIAPLYTKLEAIAQKNVEVLNG